jgi:hypothetical protein
MDTLEATMRKYNINLDSSSSNFSSHRYALYASSFLFNATSTSSSDEWIINSRACYHMAKDKSVFILLMNITPNKYLSMMIDLLVV